jgi:hypothetical protein
MSIFNKQPKQETIVYTIVWILIFLSPVVSLLTHGGTADETPEALGSLVNIWITILTFFIVFLIHNHLLAPMLVKQRRVTHYLIACVAVVTLFQFVHCSHKPNGEPLMRVHVEGEMMPPPPPGEKRPPIDRHDLSVFIIVIMMIGANLGVKSYFQNEEEKKHLADLKEKSLKQQLNYLRYQVNPHFIMNTLNNIHALVDIDPDQAKDSIVDMSRMMRYLLYESDKPYVPIKTAVEFLKKHLNLMKLRYTDMVTVNFKCPTGCSENIVIAPLLFLPFVENAFKHGVAIDKPSTIDIDIECKDDRLLFHCHNTKSGVKHEYGGVGLTNVSKRLELIYGSDYSLDITDGEEDYDVLLNIPAKTADDFNNQTKDS